MSVETCVHGLFPLYCAFGCSDTQSADHISLLRQRNAELLAQRESDREQIAKLSRLVATQLEEIRLLRTRVLSYSVAEAKAAAPMSEYMGDWNKVLR